MRATKRGKKAGAPSSSFFFPLLSKSICCTYSVSGGKEGEKQKKARKEENRLTPTPKERRTTTSKALACSLSPQSVLRLSRERRRNEGEKAFNGLIGKRAKKKKKEVSELSREMRRGVREKTKKEAAAGTLERQAQPSFSSFPHAFGISVDLEVVVVVAEMVVAAGSSSSEISKLA